MLYIYTHTSRIEMDWIDFTHTHLLKRERESFVLLLKILPFLEHKLPPARGGR